MKFLNKVLLLKKHACCILLACICINVSAQLNANFTSTSPQGCSPLIVYFTDASAGNPTQWFWDLGNGATSTDPTASAIYINPGKYTIKLIVKNAGGTDSVIKVDFINVYADPTVSFTADPLEGCAPLNVSFKDNSVAGNGNITNWIWDFGDGTTSNLQNPQHLYDISDTFNITLSVVNSFGCKQTVQQKNLVKINGLVKSGFTYTYTNVCKPPATVTFTNTSVSNSALTYKWFFGDGETDTKVNPVHVYNSSGNFIVKLVAQNKEGCTNTYQQVISIGAAKADFNYTAGCANEPVVFTDTSSPHPINEKWDFGDGTTATGDVVSHTYSGTGTFQVTLTADFGGCTDVITKSVITGQKPTADFIATGNLKTCTYPVTIQFNNQSAGAANYKWLFDDGTSSTEINPVHTYDHAGSYSVKLIAFNKNGCADTLVQNDLIQLGPPKILGVENIPFQGCVPQTITLHPVISAPDPITSYKWDFGDGTGSTDTVPVHTYSQVGIYNVTLVIRTAKGCTDSVTIVNAVSLGKHPDAAFSAKPLQSCAGDPIQFRDTSIGLITDWLWLFGDGGTSTEQNPLYKYQDTGYFSVTLIVSQYGCADTLTKPKYVYLKPPVAKFNYKSNCSDPFSYDFTDNSISPQTWFWKFGDGATDNTPNPNHTYSATGTYTVSLEVTNGNCSYTTLDSVNVIKESPSFSYKALHTNFCKYDSIEFFATNYQPENIKSFYWDFNDGTTDGYSSNLDTAYHLYTSSGNFTPELSIKDIHDCIYSVKKPLSLIIYGPVASFLNNPGDCVQNAIIFNDKSSTDGTHSITNWIWNYGDSTKQDTLTAAPFIHNYNKTGIFNVYLKVTDTNGCYDTISHINAVEITKPVAAFGTDSLSCSGNAVQFFDSSLGNTLNYNWDFGDGGFSTLQSPQHVYSAPNVYNVKLVVTDKYKCTDTLLKPSLIRVSNPVAAFTLTDSTFTCPPANVQPQNTSQNFSTLFWDFGDGNTSSELNPVHYYTTAGTYILKLVAQGFGSSCFDTITKKMILKGPQGEFNYNPFSGCNPFDISLFAKAKNTIQYIWDFGDGVTKTSADSTINYTYTSTGRFLPQLILVDSGGCRVPVVNSDTIVVYGAEAKFSNKPIINTCDSVNINFIDSSIAFLDKINSYHWNFNDGDTSVLKNPSHTYLQSKIYQPTLTVTTEKGCVSNYTYPLDIAIAFTPKITAVIPDSSCVLSPVAFSALVNNPAPDIQWLWNLGTGDTANTQNVNYAYASAGKFPVSVIANNSAGCADTIKRSVIINPLPVVDAGTDSIICLGTSDILNPSGAQLYSWLPDASLSCTDCSNPVANPLITTKYFVSGKNNFGCSATDSVIVEVKQPAEVSITAPDSLCVGNTIQLTANGEEIYSWQPADLVSQPTAAQTSSTPNTTTTYTLIGTDSKRCFSDTAFKTVHVFPYPVIQIPDSVVTITSGSDYHINTIGSEDILSWQWAPVNWLSCTNCAQPVATPKITTKYTVTAKNIAGCTVEKNITINVLCKNELLFIPNTFSPNQDGMNDYFYPRGKGFSVKSFRIFSRWGNIVFEQNNFLPNNQSYGWNGKYKGNTLQPDVYVFVIEVICENGDVFTSKGNVTLLR